jgi:PAS domain S-box-containing protein
MHDAGPPQDLRDYFESSPVALSLAAADGDHELVLINRPFRELTGYSTSEIVGRNCRFLQGEQRDETALTPIRAFLRRPDQSNVRVPILNYRKDGLPFVNLLYMSRLRSQDGRTSFIFASQFDISRTQNELLVEYDFALRQTLHGLNPVVAESGLIVEGTLHTIANSAATIAQAKVTLSELDNGSFL